MAIWRDLRDLSLAVALPFWGAIGGGVGLALMAFDQGWVSLLVSVLLGIIVALSLDHLNLRRRLRDIEEMARPNVVVHSLSTDVRLLYETNRVTSEPKVTPRGFVTVAAVTFVNDPRVPSDLSQASAVVADVTFRKDGNELVNATGVWRDNAEPAFAPVPQFKSVANLATIDFGIGIKRELLIAFRFPIEGVMWALDVTSYQGSLQRQLGDWRIPKFMMRQTEVDVSIRLRGVGVDSTTAYILRRLPIPQDGGAPCLSLVRLS